MSGPKYPHQQLRSVRLETYFPGRFSTFTELERLRLRFEDELPHLFVPNAQPDAPLALAPYHLRSGDQAESLAISMNQVSYISFDYEGHEAFMERAFGLMEPTLRALAVTRLNRVQYVYNNEIGLERRADGTLPLGDVLDLGTSGWCGFDRLGAVNMRWVRQWDRGQMIHHVVVEETDGVEVLKVDLAASVSPAGAAEHLRELAGAAHERAVGCFESMITESFRAEISGHTTDEEPDDV